MLESLFGKKESIEEIIIHKPFNEKLIHKRLSSFDLDPDNPFLLHLCAKNNCYDALGYLIRNKNMNVNALNSNGEHALFSAIKNNAIESAKVLLINKVNFYHADLKGTTCFHLSAKFALMELFNIFINTVKDKTIEDQAGRNILFYAVESKNKEMVKRVLETTKIDINSRDNENNTISHVPEISENRSLLDYLIDLGLDIDSLNDRKEDFIYINCLNLELDEELIDLALKHSSDINKEYELRDNNILRRIIRKILSIDIQVFENKGLVTKYQERLLTFIEHGINENSLDKQEENILFDIVRSRDDLILDYILNRTKININQTNIYGQSLLDMAIFNVKPKIEMIKKLVYSNINCTLPDKHNYTVIEKLVDVIISDALPNRIRKIGKTKSYNNVNYSQILNLILDYSKIDIDTLTFDDEPLIFEVAKSFYVPLLEVLKKYGANLNITSPLDDLNVFYKVLESGKDAKDEKQLFLKTLNFLVSNNVNLDNKDSFGGTVVHKAILDHDLAVVNVITKKVVNFTARDRKGRTYIHNTVWKDKVDILKKVAFKDRDLINKADRFGILPINYAVIMGKKDVVFTLIKLGAFLNNPNQVNQQFKEQFFSKLGRLDDILSSSMSVNERTLMTKLVRSMQEELNIN